LFNTEKGINKLYKNNVIMYMFEEKLSTMHSPSYQKTDRQSSLLLATSKLQYSYSHGKSTQPKPVAKKSTQPNLVVKQPTQTKPIAKQTI
jgi:hypothetical protein